MARMGTTANASLKRETEQHIDAARTGSELVNVVNNSEHRPLELKPLDPFVTTKLLGTWRNQGEREGP
jgi:hypothetical protein